MSLKASMMEGVYARVPEIQCKGLCTDSCGPVNGSRFEVERLEAMTGRKLGHGPDLTCTMLEGGRCVGYAYRPLVCRLFGVVGEMPCPHGCRPKRWLTRLQGFKLLAAAERIGGKR
jgi:Fe-S-cluster containining protein